MQQEAGFRQRHSNSHVCLHGLRAGGAVVRIHACGHIHCYHRFGKLIDELARALSCGTQLTSEARAEDGVHHNAGAFQRQLGGEPIFVGCDSAQAATGGLKHGQLAGCVTGNFILTRTN